jgi:uroporphyrin-III C-methyltransferase / precorrin-2 dehydrogenase / sirohydrochlorin ferrochelatase
MKHLPLFFDLRGRRVVVIGEGGMADRRAVLAASAGALVSRETCAPFAFDGAAAVFVATGDAGSDASAADAARAAGVPVNVADRPALCDFIMPAIVERDDLVVAISTGGTSPTLAQAVRARIEAALPERIAALGRLASAFRGQVQALIADSTQRRAFWRGLVTGPAAALALAGDEQGARRLALRALNDARGSAGTPRQGIAHIVGAGPGDPDLLTLRAVRLLQEADVILHDDLVPPAVLARARRDAELVSVGKRKGRHSWHQDEINAELLRRVRGGQTVVRLKAGDPFVFGRGGEEVDALREAGLAVSVVPGITAAIGCAASVGIPLTHRKLASAVTFVSGHTAKDAPGAAWAALAAQGHTLAIYMGTSEAASVRDRLLAAGTAPDMPVALIENGTRPDERVTTGRLADLARLAGGHAARDAGPSLIIVGAVAALGARADQPLLAEVS